VCSSALASVSLFLYTAHSTYGKVDFSKIEKQIDAMVVVLKDEQATDEAKVEQCEKSLASSAEKIKDLAWKIKQYKASIAEKQDELDKVSSEIDTTTETIKQLDDDVKEATAQRKKENAHATALVAANEPAIKLLQMAKARMDKFYSPKHESKKSSSLVQISSHTQLANQAVVAYQTQKKGSHSVITMLDELTQDLKHEIVVAEAGEKRSQADFETEVAESATRRAEMANTLVKKEAVKADLEGDLVNKQQALKTETTTKLDADKIAMAMKSDCDFIMTNLPARTEARKAEREDLIDTKATLHGAVFVQSGKLRGAKAL